MEYLIKNVKVYDGSGENPFTADVMTSGSKIAAVGENLPFTTSAGDVIDGSGLCLAPGFADAHTHSDQQVYGDPSRKGRLLQGITSEIGGQCGSSKAPYTPDMPEVAKDFMLSSYGKTVWYETFREQLDAVSSMKLGCHQKYFVGERLMRASVCGMEDRPATKAEIDRMCGMAEEAMQAGALGLSTHPAALQEPTSWLQLQKSSAVTAECTPPIYAMKATSWWRL